MRVQIPAATLKTALAHVAKAAPNRSRLPILDCVQLHAEGGRVTLTATDLSLFLRYSTDCTVQQGGVTALPIKPLGAWLGRLPATALLTLTSEGETVHAECAGYQAQFPSHDPAECPILPATAEPPLATMPIPVLRDMIQQVVFAAAPEDPLPALTGVAMILCGRDLTLVAANRHRMATRTTTCLTQTPAAETRLLIPAKALRELGRSLQGMGLNSGSAQLFVQAQRGAIIITAGRLTLGALQIEGPYPDVGGTLPPHTPTRVVTPTHDLLAALQSVGAFAREDSGIIRLTSSPATTNAPSQLTVSTAAVGGGTGTVQIAAHVDGPGSSVAFTAAYVRDTLRALPSTQVEIQTDTDARLGLFRPVGQAGTLHLIMACRHAA